MVDKITGLNVNIAPKIKPQANNSQTNFMNVLRDKFEEMTGKLNKVPGLPDVYTVNTPTVDFVNNINITKAPTQPMV
ncbi:MAG: hypothetical protein KKA31_04960 [Candidatus Margulisbacteria bacterium]|nr:hypothetical protein [Candidatus Margulisiibacteriota bacterium]